jgi:hypothetical protein
MAATTNNVYIESVGATNYPDGIYEIDPQTGNLKSNLPLSPSLFSVSQDDQFLFAYDGNGYVNVYSISDGSN